MGEREREDSPPVTPADESGAVAASSDPSAGQPAQARAAGDAQGDRTPAEIQRDIEQTREELGDTVAALAEKTDVKARTKDKVQEVKDSVVGKKDEVVGKAQAKKDEFASKAQDSTPSSIDTGQVAATAREKAQEPPAIAAGAFVAGFLIGVIVTRRRSR